MTTTVTASTVDTRHTMPIRVELRRQLLRRRTQVAFGLIAALPVILWIAFTVAPAGPPTGSLNLVDLAKGSGANFAVFTLFASASFLLVVVVALFFGDTVAVRGVLVEPALPARRPDPAGPAGAAEGDRRPGCSRWPRSCCCPWSRCSWARSPTARTTSSAPPASR